MEAIDIRALEEAVVIFYQSGSSQHAAAHEWLTKAQASSQAWSFVWDLMRLEKPSEIQFFGATTLHSKLLKSWSEVPKANYEELKQKLLDTIILFGAGPRIVLNRLCISLSAFIVQMIDEWPTAIEDVSNTFQNYLLPNVPEKTQIWIMMEVLCGIPEESLGLATSVHRLTLQNKINERAPFVQQIIEQYLNSKCEAPTLDREDMLTLLRAAKCAHVWLKNNGFSIDKCEYMASCLLKVVNKCYWNCLQHDGCMSADENELAETCLDTLTAMMIQPDSHRFTTTALTLMKMFLDSLTPITKAEYVKDNLNEDIAVAIYTLFMTSIESHSRLLLAGVLAESAAHQELYQRLIQELLQCTDKPGIYPVEESSSILAMGFWYMLQEEILTSDNEAQRTKCIGLITPLYVHLSHILVRKAQRPGEDSIDKWTTDDLESFRCYRQDISDTLMYCYDVLHDHLLDNLVGVLNESVISVRKDSRNWTHLEACIYAFGSVAEHIETFERKNIPQLLKVLNEIPYETLCDQVLGTALETIGAFCEWFKENPEYLPSVIELLVRGLNSTQAPQATLGLKDICRECQPEMKAYAQPLLKACEQSLLRGNLKQAECVRLMFSIGKLMSMLPEDQILPSLDTMVSPCFEELQSILNAAVINDSSSMRALFRLSMISTLFSSLNINTEAHDGSLPPSDEKRTQPVLFVMQKTMPIFKGIGEMYINHQPGVIEALCFSLKHALTNLMNDFRPMLPDLCNLIVSILQARCVPPAVDIAKTCVIMFYKDPVWQNTMRELHSQVVLYNLQTFEQIPDDQMSNISDLLEVFFSFSAHIVKKIPEAFTNPNIDSIKILAFATRTLTLPENGAVKCAISFICHFVTNSRSFANTTHAVMDRGQEIVKTALICVAVRTPRTHVEAFADIFMALNKKYVTETAAWMKILEVPDFPAPGISETDKEQFLKAILREMSNKRLMQVLIRTFAANCRGLPVKL